MSATQRLHRIRIKRFSDIGLRDQAIGQLCADVAILERKNSSFSDDHDVLKGRKPGFVQSEKFAQQALDPVSLHRVPGFPADRHADSSGAHWVPACDDGEMRRVSPYALLIDPRIILSFPNTFMFAKGVGFHGVPPLSRGLADLPLLRTARPPRVAIRTRKPWVRFLLVLLNVVKFFFMVQTPSER
jgi:hypothetical protein